MMRKLGLTAILLMGASPAFAGGPSGFPSALPPVSNPGECYAQVKVPAQYSTATQTVVKQDGYAKLAVTEPELRARTEDVMVKEPSVRFEVRQPSYRTTQEQILTRPAYDRLSVSAPQFSTVNETLQTSAPRLVWKRGNPADLQRQGYLIHSTADGRLRGDYTGGSYASTQAGGDQCGPGCEIWCLVEEPGSSVTTSRRVMSAPSRVVRTPVAAQYQTLTKQVLADPGGVREIEVPAEFRSVTVHDIVRPAEAYEVNVPAEYGEVQTRELMADERYEWRRVMCAPGTAGTAGVSHGSSYSSATTYQSGTTYAAPRYSTYTAPQPTYTAPQTQTQTGYYGTENYPAYQNRAPHRRRR